MERLGMVVVGILGTAVIAIVAVVASTSSSSTGAAYEAMNLMPADVEFVVVSDLARQRDRLGYGELTSESPESEVDEYLGATVEEPWVGSSLGGYAIPMLDDWGWSFIDVEWEAAYSGEDAYAVAYKLRDDLDMSRVEQTFVDKGYERSDADGYPAYSLDLDDLGDGETPIPSLLRTVVIPDRNLVLAGPDAEALVETADGDAESASDSGVAGGLVAAVDAPEYLAVAVGGSACVDPMDALGPSGSPEAQEALESSLAETPGYSDLSDPVGHLAAITVAEGEPRAEAVVAYGDGGDAEADVEPRQAMLDNGASAATGEPYTDLLSATAKAEGNLVRYDLEGEDARRILPSMVQRFDLPWAYCSPEG